MPNMGGRPCLICSDSNTRRTVNKYLDEGMSIGVIAKRLDRPASNIARHRKNHWGAAKKVLDAMAAEPESSLASAKQVSGAPKSAPNYATLSMSPAEIVQAATLLFQRGEKLFDAALSTGNVKDALNGLEVVRRSLEFCAKLAGMLDKGPQTVVDQRSIVFAGMQQLTLDELRALAYGQPIAPPQLLATGETIEHE